MSRSMRVESIDIRTMSGYSLNLKVFIGYASLAGSTASTTKYVEDRSTTDIIIGSSILAGFVLLVIVSALYCRFCTKGKRIRRKRRNTLIAAIILEAAADSQALEDSAEESLNEDDVILPVFTITPQPDMIHDVEHPPPEPRSEDVENDVRQPVVFIAPRSDEKHYVEYPPPEPRSKDVEEVKILSVASLSTPSPRQGTSESRSKGMGVTESKESPRSARSSLTPIEEFHHDLEVGEA